MDWIQAFVIGLMGSFHCIGMCGPIALSLPLKSNSVFSRLISSLTYNTGRIITYGVLGLVFGFMGKGLYMGGLQQWTSILAGSVMILSVLFPLIFKNTGVERGLNNGLSFVKQGFRKFLSIHSYSSVFMIGLLNGILPCGLVYIALAGALVSIHPVNGTFFMLIFGLGTLPVMFLLPLVGSVISLKFRKSVGRIIPAFIILIGILFILRGLNLGIPYVSPHIEKHSLKANCCHSE